MLFHFSSPVLSEPSILVTVKSYNLPTTSTSSVLVTLTIPITGITLGLFYPCINVFLLKLTDWILGPHFQITNLFVAIFAAVLLSITNFIMEEIIKTIINKVKTHE